MEACCRAAHGKDLFFVAKDEQAGSDNLLMKWPEAGLVFTAGFDYTAIRKQRRSRNAGRS